MPKIKLSDGDTALVDHDDFAYLSQWKWSKKGKYAGRGVRHGGRGAKYVNVYMHKEVAKRKGLRLKGRVIDHRNRRKLDNRRRNLRSVTKRVDFFNKSVRADSESKEKGIYRRASGRYSASITFHGRVHWLGTFDSIKGARNARHKKETELLAKA